MTCYELTGPDLNVDVNETTGWMVLWTPAPDFVNMHPAFSTFFFSHLCYLNAWSLGLSTLTLPHAYAYLRNTPSTPCIMPLKTQDPYARLTTYPNTPHFLYVDHQRPPCTRFTLLLGPRGGGLL